jgi:quinohemoprotein ethanol dehydrogenase
VLVQAQNLPARARAQYALPWNGGTVTTAGNLVFQGTSDGRFIAYQADTGKKVWEFHAGTGIIAAPVTYLFDGQQYVSVLAGWGGAFALVAGDAALAAGANNSGRLLTFKLGGTATLPKYEVADRTPTPLPATASAEEVQRGKRLYHQWCAACHGAEAISGGVLPDLLKLDRLRGEKR